MIIQVAGASRRAYTDRTQKTIYVTIKSGETPVLSREYTLTAASLEWDVKWEERGNLEILFFDFPEGVSIYSPNVEQVKAMQELAVRFTFDEGAKKFVESQVPANVIRHARAPK